MAEEDKDKTEKATPFKLREAKRKGQVMKSLEFNSLFVIAGFLLAISIWGDSMVSRNLMIDRAVFENAHQVNFEISQLVSWLGHIGAQVLFAVSPLILILIVIVILSNMVQTGPIFTFFPLKPDIQRINPIKGFKRVFSLKMLFEAFKSLIKLTLFGTILYFVLTAMIPTFMGLMHMDPDYYPVRLLDMAIALVFKLALAILLVALLDFLYTRWDFSNKMKMSRREVKEEVKRREGDPHVRAKIKELQREAAKRAKSLKRVPDADVLITNPTHLAIAMVYQRGESHSPQIIAKGAGELAQNMKEVARRHRVPIVESKALARSLYRKVEMDGFIPESFYAAAARILAQVYARRELRAGLGSPS